MNTPGPWVQANELRKSLPSDVVAAIDAVARELPDDADVDTTIRALHAHDLWIFHCLIGLVALRDINLGDAKMLVHQHPLFAATRDDREAFWEDLHKGLEQAAERGEIRLVRNDPHDEPTSA